MATYRRWNVTDQVEDFLDNGEPYAGDPHTYSETVWPYDYRRSYVPSRTAYGVYPTRVPSGAEMPFARPGTYVYEESVSIPDAPRVYAPVSDEQIRDRIFDRLDHDYRIPADADIQVTVVQGVVTLTGSVRNRRTKEIVGQHAWQQPGVEDVHNNVSITGRWRQSRQL